MKFIDEVIAVRQETHGDFRDVAAVSEGTLDLWRRSRNWDQLPPYMREGLKMVAHKVARVLSGDPMFRDHWDDLSGYAARVASYIPVPPRAEDAPGGADR